MCLFIQCVSRYGFKYTTESIYLICWNLWKKQTNNNNKKISAAFLLNCVYYSPAFYLFIYIYI